MQQYQHHSFHNMAYQLIQIVHAVKIVLKLRVGITPKLK
jgi:hypothetical protein